MSCNDFRLPIRVEISHVEPAGIIVRRFSKNGGKVDAGIGSRKISGLPDRISLHAKRTKGPLQQGDDLGCSISLCIDGYRIEKAPTCGGLDCSFAARRIIKCRDRRADRDQLHCTRILEEIGSQDRDRFIGSQGLQIHSIPPPLVEAGANLEDQLVRRQPHCIGGRAGDVTGEGNANLLTGKKAVGCIENMGQAGELPAAGLDNATGMNSRVSTPYMDCVGLATRTDLLTEVGGDRGSELR